MKRKILLALSFLTLNNLFASQELQEEQKTPKYVLFELPETIKLTDCYNAEDTIPFTGHEEKYDPSKCSFEDYLMAPKFLPARSELVFLSGPEYKGSSYRSSTKFYENFLDYNVRVLVVHGTSSPGSYAHEDKNEVNFYIQYNMHDFFDYYLEGEKVIATRARFIGRNIIDYRTLN